MLLWQGYGCFGRDTGQTDADKGRTNIGNAKLANLQEDLHMSDNQYNDALTIFFVSYSVFEPLTNVLLKRMRPSIFIPIIMLLWVCAMDAVWRGHLLTLYRASA